MTKRLISAALTGCLVWAASSTPVKADPIYVEVQTAPRAIETYPHTVYEGRPVYYYEGRWYYRHGPRWVYYREEPRPLVEFRAGPAYHHHHHRDYDRRGHDRRDYDRPRHREQRRHHHHHER